MGGQGFLRASVGGEVADELLRVVRAAGRDDVRQGGLRGGQGRDMGGRRAWRGVSRRRRGGARGRWAGVGRVRGAGRRAARRGRRVRRRVWRWTLRSAARWRLISAWSACRAASCGVRVGSAGVFVGAGGPWRGAGAVFGLQRDDAGGVFGGEMVVNFGVFGVQGGELRGEGDMFGGWGTARASGSALDVRCGCTLAVGPGAVRTRWPVSSCRASPPAASVGPAGHDVPRRAGFAARAAAGRPARPSARVTRAEGRARRRSRRGPRRCP